MIQDQSLFAYAAVALAFLMAAWALALWRNYALLQRMAFRVVPFVLVIALFSIAFYSERMH